MIITSNRKYVLASFIVILITVGVDQLVFITPRVSETQPEKIKQSGARAQNKVSEAIENKHDSMSPPKFLTRLAFINTRLPLPPNLTLASPVQEGHKPDRFNQAQPKSISPELPKRNRIKLHRKQTQAQATKTQYAQLSQLDNTNLRLRFPNNVRETQQILRFMHDCIGISLGAYDARKQDASRLTLLTYNNQNHSTIMRLVFGQKTERERALMQAYAPNLQLARLYPKSFDYALSSKIAAYIGANGLNQFSGTYQLRGNELLLKSVTINNKATQQNWSLAQVSVCGTTPELALN